MGVDQKPLSMKEECVYRFDSRGRRRNILECLDKERQIFKKRKWGGTSTA